MSERYGRSVNTNQDDHRSDTAGGMKPGGGRGLVRIRPVGQALIVAVVSFFSFCAIAGAGESVSEPVPNLYEFEDIDSAGDARKLVARLKEKHRDQLSTRSAIAERKESIDKFEGMGRSGVVDLLQSTFGTIIDKLTASPTEPLLEADKIVSFESPTAAVINPAGPRDRSLIVSSSPLRTEDGKLPDPALHLSSGDFSPAEALVPVTIPKDVSEPIELDGTGLAIGFEGTRSNAPEASAIGTSENDDSDSLALYPNAYRDTDIAVAAIPQGVETFAHVRSAEGPERFVMDLDVPDGAELVAGADGGAEINSDEGDGQITIYAPTAVDAQGAEVPVTMTVDGKSLVIDVPHRGKDLAYPLLVDPVIDTWNWHNSTHGTIWGVFPGWLPQHVGTTNFEVLTSCQPLLTNSCNASGTGTGQGLHSRAVGGQTYPANSSGMWRYTAPGTDSYIASASIGSWRYHKGVTGDSPAAWWGLKDATGTWQASGGRFDSDAGSSLVFDGTNPNPALRAKHFDAGLWALVAKTMPAGVTNSNYNRIAQVTMELADANPPALTINEAWTPTGWIDDESFMVWTYATDSGLGVKDITASTANYPSYLPTPTYEVKWTPDNNCVGGVQSPCPAASPFPTALTFDPTRMASGRREIAVEARDPLLKDSPTRTFYVNVDHEGPNLTISGGAKDPVNPTPYLIIEAVDSVGTISSLRSGVKSIDVRIGNDSAGWESFHSETFTCNLEFNTCPQRVKRTVNVPLSKLTATGMRLKVLVKDQLGHEGKEGSAVPNWPSPIPVSHPSGPNPGSGNPCMLRANRKTLNAKPDSRGVLRGTTCADRIDLSNPRYNGTRRVEANSGEDLIIASNDDQVILGGDGNDEIYTGRNNDKLYGEGGDDLLVGGMGDDILKGGSGNDRILGGHGADTMRGDGGDDFLQGGQGSDNIAGGAGTNDTVSFADGISPGFDTTIPMTSGGTPVPQVQGFPSLASEDRGVRVDLGHLSPTNKIAPYAMNGPPRLGGAKDVLCAKSSKGTSKEPGCTGPVDIERVEGSAFSDILFGTNSSVRETFLGGGGADYIKSGGGPDRINGGHDGDVIDGGGSSEIIGGPGTDGCFGRSGDAGKTVGCENSGNTVDPRTRDGIISVGQVHPVSGLGDPGDAPAEIDLYMRGSAGADNIKATYAESPRRVIFQIGGAGGGWSYSGAFAYSASPEGCEDPTAKGTITCNLGSKKLGAIVLSGGPGSDSLMASNFQPEHSVYILGGLDRDRLEGGIADEIIVDGDNQDSAYREVLIGGGGDDVIIENRGSDSSNGSAGNDLLMSTALCNDDQIDGGGGLDNSQWAQLPKWMGTEGWKRGAYVNLNSGVTGSFNVDHQNDTSPRCSGIGAEQTGSITRIDRIESSNNPDYLKGDSGENKFIGRGHRDVFNGGPGPGANTIIASDGWGDSHRDFEIDCGPGGGKAKYNRTNNRTIDPTPTNCNKRDPLGEPRYGGPAADYYQETASATPTPTSGALGSDVDAEEGDDAILTSSWDSDYADIPASMFSLGETSGSAAKNTIGELDEGEYLPNATWTAGDTPDDGPELNVESPVTDASIDDGAVRLDGVDDEIILTPDADPAISPATGYSIEMWVQLEPGTTEREYLFSRGAADSGVHLYREPDGHVVFETRNGTETYSATSFETIADSEWHHVVGTIQNETVSVYLDGEVTSTGYWTDITPKAPEAGVNRVGTAAGITEHTEAVVDNVAIYGQELTPVDVLNSMADSEVETPDISWQPEISTADADSDGVFDVIDNCSAVANEGQLDTDENGIGDACDTAPDPDGDEVLGGADNCPDYYNPEQEDTDSDGVGDVCADVIEDE